MNSTEQSRTKIDPYDNYLSIALGKEAFSQQKIEQFERNYHRFFPKDKSAAIIDIGPGRGEMLKCLDSRGYNNLSAIDISESVVEHIKQLGFDVVSEPNMVSFFSQSPNKYRLVTMCDVVEHIPRETVLEIISAIHQSLTDDGVLIVQIPNMQSITSDIFRYDDFTHVAGYTERSIAQMLTLCGFSSVECYGFEFLDNSFRSKIHKALRSLLWFCERTKRNINGTMPHRIMHPVFFAIAKK